MRPLALRPVILFANDRSYCALDNVAGMGYSRAINRLGMRRQRLRCVSLGTPGDASYRGESCTTTGPRTRFSGRDGVSRTMVCDSNVCRARR